MKIKKNKYDIIISFLSLLCLVGTVVFLIISWKTIPDEIPGHYSAAGEVDKVPQIWNTGVQVTEQNKEKIYRILKTMIGTIKLLVVLMFSYLTLYSTTGKSLSLLFMPVFLILMFGSVAFFIFQLVKDK